MNTLRSLTSGEVAMVIISLDRLSTFYKGAAAPMDREAAQYRELRDKIEASPHLFHGTHEEA